MTRARTEPRGKEAEPPCPPADGPALVRAVSSGATIHRGALACRFRQEDVYAHFAWSDADELTGLWCFGRRRVFKARSKVDSGRSVAVRHLPKCNANDVDLAWSEIGILSELDHPG